MLGDIAILLMANEACQSLIAPLDLMALANIPPMDVGSWSKESRAEVVRWCAGSTLPVPKVLAEYCQCVKEATKKGRLTNEC